MASTINPNETYTILGSTLQGICDSVSKATGAEDVPVPMIPKMIDGINLKYEDIKDVMFMDYNGDLLYSWDKDDFIQNVNALPPGPTWHENLTFQEWNWDLADIKEELNKSGACCVGACYTTKDGATHFYIDIEDEADLNISFYIARQSGNVVINWGDGNSTTATGNGLQYHSYASLGEYDIKVTGNFIFTGNNYLIRRDPGSAKRTGNWWIKNNNFLKRIEVGTNSVFNITHAYIFAYCTELTSISVHKDIFYPANATNMTIQGWFRGSPRIRFFTFPTCFSDITTTVTYASVDFFQSTSSLVSFSLPKNAQFPRCNMTGFSGAKFLYIPYVQSVTITNTSYCPVFSNLPRMLRFSWAFDSSSVAYTNGWYQTFQNDYALRKVSLDKMHIGPLNRYTCVSNFSLEGEITLPATYTAFTGDNFTSDYSIEKFTMLGDITAVGVTSGNVFSGCYNCLCWDFTHCTAVPTLYNTNCFTGINAGAKIVVPDSLVSSWKAATNWSNSDIANKIIGESDYNA